MDLSLIAMLSNGLVTKLNTVIKCSDTYLWTASKSLETGMFSTYIREDALLEIVRTEPSAQCDSG